VAAPSQLHTTKKERASHALLLARCFTAAVPLIFMAKILSIEGKNAFVFISMLIA